MLTSRQRQAVQLIFYWKTETGSYPSYQCLADMLGVSRGNSYKFVERLCERKILRQVRGGFEFNQKRYWVARMFTLAPNQETLQTLGFGLIEKRELPKEKRPVRQDESLLVD